MTARAGCVIASDLPRATASAERIAAGRVVVRVTPLLRETPLDVPRWIPARWPLGVWGVGIYLHWLVRERRGQLAAPAELERTAQAAALLDDVAREANTVVAVTHGAFRRLLAMRLIATGWTAEPRVGGFRNWSWWSFRRAS